MKTIQIDPLWIEIGGPALAAGIVLGALFAWLIARGRHKRLADDIRLLESRIKDQSALQTERDSAYEAATTQLATAFSNLANQSLKSNSETFLRLAEQNLGAQHERAKRELGSREQAVENLVKPIKEALQQSQAQISELEKARSEAYGGIKSQLESMQTSQQTLAQETHNLAKALRRPEVRGRWGEITLRRLVELAGMVEHCDFQEQVHTSAEDKVIRPDMIVRMPGRREIVIDVKTPLDAYLNAIEADSDEQREQHLVHHAKKVRERIRELASKSYWGQFKQSPDFVVLFIPGDHFLSAALEKDSALLEDALKQKVILATPTSLVALLRAVAFGWNQQSITDNAEKIRDLGEDLYKRLCTFTGHMNKVGKGLNSSLEHYNKAVGSFERQVLSGARKFTEMGISASKQPDTLEPIEKLARSLEDPINKIEEKQ